MKISKNHSKRMQKIIEEYTNSVDKDIYEFVKDVKAGRDVLPLTVGFITDEMADKEDIRDIARLSYVLANYDSIEWDGGVSSLYKTKNGKKAPQITIKKRVNGTYYIIEVVSDSKKKRNIVSSIYLQKAAK